MTDANRALPPIDAAERFAVEEVIKRFGLSIDLRDWDMFGACLDDSVLMDLDPKVAKTPDVKLPRKAVVASAKTSFERYDATLHMYSVATVDFDEAGAAVRTNFMANHYREDEPGDRTFVQYGLYLHRLRRQDDARWVVTEWHQTVRFSTGNRALMDRD